MSALERTLRTIKSKFLIFMKYRVFNALEFVIFDFFERYKF